MNERDLKDYTPSFKPNLYAIRAVHDDDEITSFHNIV